MDHASPTLGVVTMPAQALQQTGISFPIEYTPSTIPVQETQLWIYTRCSYNACAGSAANGYLHLKYTPSTIPVQETCTIIIVDLHRCSTMPAQALQQTGIII